MSKSSKKEKVKIVSVWLCVLVFLLAFGAGVASKFIITPSWAKAYSVKWSDEIGTLEADIPYGEGEANKFDLYLPADSGRESYGLVVYLHAGGFTMGDKADDKNTLAWLCSKGYVAAGINYTLHSEAHPEASVLTQSNEIKAAMPQVIEAARAAGYNVTEMAMAGGSAGACLAMVYTYRDGAEAPVPIRMLYQMVGPSSFYREDWGIYGLDKDTDESVDATIALFGAMSGHEITREEVRSGAYQEYMEPISAINYVKDNPVPSLLLYGTEDRFQPYAAVYRLENALKTAGADYQLFVAPHSGHGVQNDDAVMRQFMEAVDEYLDKYMPVK